MSDQTFRPYVPENVQMSEFTLRAVLLGLVMTVILGAANAYLGLSAGMTIAATYPAAVIGMAVLRLLQGLHPRREHRANGGIHRRIGGRGRHLHHSGVRDFQSLAVVRLRACLLEIQRADGRGRRPGHAVRHPAAARDGGGSGAALPRIGGRLRDSQGRTARQPGRQDSLFQHGLRRGRVPARSVPAVRRQQGLLPARRPDGPERGAPGQQPRTPIRSVSAASPRSPRRPSARRIWAWATSSARAWRR